MSCSNCYSDHVIITKIWLGFEDWGPQNGGAEEQKARWEAAVKAGEESSVPL